MSAPLDLTKPVQTCDGRPARIICTDARFQGVPTVMALATSKDGGEYQVFGTDDLVNVPMKHSGWLAVLPGHEFARTVRPAMIYPTEAEAKALSSAVFFVEWQEPA